MANNFGIMNQLGFISPSGVETTNQDAGISQQIQQQQQQQRMLYEPIPSSEFYGPGYENHIVLGGYNFNPEQWEEYKVGGLGNLNTPISQIFSNFQNAPLLKQGSKEYFSNDLYGNLGYFDLTNKTFYSKKWLKWYQEQEQKKQQQNVANQLGFRQTIFTR